MSVKIILIDTSGYASTATVSSDINALDVMKIILVDAANRSQTILCDPAKATPTAQSDMINRQHKPTDGPIKVHMHLPLMKITSVMCNRGRACWNDDCKYMHGNCRGSVPKTIAPCVYGSRQSHTFPCINPKCAYTHYGSNYVMWRLHGVRQVTDSFYKPLLQWLKDHVLPSDLPNYPIIDIPPTDADTIPYELNILPVLTTYSECAKGFLCRNNQCPYLHGNANGSIPVKNTPCTHGSRHCDFFPCMKYNCEYTHYGTQFVVWWLNIAEHVHDPQYNIVREWFDAYVCKRNSYVNVHVASSSLSALKRTAEEAEISIISAKRISDDNPPTSTCGRSSANPIVLLNSHPMMTMPAYVIIRRICEKGWTCADDNCDLMHGNYINSRPTKPVPCNNGSRCRDVFPCTDLRCGFSHYGKNYVIWRLCIRPQEMNPFYTTMSKWLIDHDYASIEETKKYLEERSIASVSMRAGAQAALEPGEITTDAFGNDILAEDALQVAAATPPITPAATLSTAKSTNIPAVKVSFEEIDDIKSDSNCSPLDTLTQPPAPLTQPPAPLTQPPAPLTDILSASPSITTLTMTTLTTTTLTTTPDTPLSSAFTIAYLDCQRGYKCRDDTCIRMHGNSIGSSPQKSTPCQLGSRHRELFPCMKAKCKYSHFGENFVNWWLNDIRHIHNPRYAEIKQWQTKRDKLAMNSLTRAYSFIDD